MSISALDWAKGAMATHLLSQSTQAVFAPRLKKKDFDAAVRILRDAPKDDKRAQELLKAAKEGLPKATPMRGRSMKRRKGL